MLAGLLRPDHTKYRQRLQAEEFRLVCLPPGRLVIGHQSQELNRILWYMEAINQ
jgi:hypothetical protein